jgi:hypothetical protein
VFCSFFIAPRAPEGARGQSSCIPRDSERKVNGIKGSFAEKTEDFPAKSQEFPVWLEEFSEKAVKKEKFPD